MKKTYDVIVLGCGGIGSAALYWLSRTLGENVLGIEQFSHGHEKGGSHDHSRIIRLSYDHVDYTRLAPDTYTCFAELEQESGVQLVYKTGGLDIGPLEDGKPFELEDYITAMRDTNIPFETWSAAETMKHFPQFRLPENARVLYQKDSGLVDARKGVQVHALMAQARGAVLLENTPVRAIKTHKDGIEIVTDEGNFHAGKLIVTAGAWLNTILAMVNLKLPITVTREQVTYFKSPHLKDFAIGKFPIWIYSGNRQHYFYGFPVYGEVAVKAAEDVGGQITTADTRGFEKDKRSDITLKSFLSAHLPTALGPELYTKTCLYDMTPDRDFIVDFLPQHPNILIVHGAAHAYKFTSLLGKISSQLITTSKTPYNINRFRLDRPALTEVDYKPVFKIHSEPLTDWPT
jgi:sarcosine oxidase